MRLSEELTWPVVWPSRRRHGLGVLSAILEAGIRVGAPISDPSTAASAGRGNRAADADIRLPDDPHAELPLERLVLEGDDGELQHVVLTTSTAIVEGAPELDVASGTLLHARSRDDEPHKSDAAWEAQVELGGQTYRLYGPWLSLAWLGRLAGWPTPVDGSSASGGERTPS